MKRPQRLLAVAAAFALVLVGAMGAVLLAGGNGSPSPQTVQAQEMMRDRGISVEGQGQISVSPDVAYVSLGVEVEGSDLESLRADADERMNDVVDALLDLGIEDSDIQTTVYDIRVHEERVEPFDQSAQPDTATSDEPEPASEDEADEADEADDAADEADDAVTTEEDDEDADLEPGVEVGTQTYILTQMVQVRIADIDMVGEVIDTALDSGANRVSNIRFEVEDRQDAIEQARELAVEEARAKAEHLAELTGVSLGFPLQIDESSPSGPAMRMEDVAMEMDAADDGMMASRIEPGEQVISVWVWITYGIE
jgi:uncharacterized protein